MKFISALALMVVCGIAAFLAAASFMMNLGLKLHANYEYYGTFPSVLFVYGCGVVGFVSPALLVWWLRRNNWKFGLRELLIAVSAIGFLLAAYAWSL
jgi:hypothetical protein